jgi:hypothetical protein
MHRKKTANEITAAGRQSILDPDVVVRRHDIRNVAEFELASIFQRFSKIVLPGSKIKGSARVHRWTPYKHTDPIRI